MNCLFVCERNANPLFRVNMARGRGFLFLSLAWKKMGSVIVLLEERGSEILDFIWQNAENQVFRWRLQPVLVRYLIIRLLQNV